MDQSASFIGARLRGDLVIVVDIFVEKASSSVVEAIQSEGNPFVWDQGGMDNAKFTQHSHN
jgi:hypothetical protein